MGDTERVISLLEQILGELKAFNRSVPLLNDLAGREEAIQSVKNRNQKRKDGATKTWRRFKENRGDGNHHASPSKKEKPGD